MSGDDRLTVYLRPGCPFCARLKARLKLARMPYRAVDIWQDRAAAALVRAHNDGNELVPTVVVDGKRWLSNPSFGELKAALR